MPSSSVDGSARTAFVLRGSVPLRWCDTAYARKLPNCLLGGEGDVRGALRALDVLGGGAWWQWRVRDSHVLVRCVILRYEKLVLPSRLGRFEGTDVAPDLFARRIMIAAAYTVAGVTKLLRRSVVLFRWL